MPRILVRTHLRNRRPVRSHKRRIKKIPQKINSLWHNGFIHGPRKKQPSDFANERIYIVSQDFGKKRHLTIPKSIPKKIEHFAQKEKLELPKDYKKKMRLKVGTLKDTNKLEIQSFITPIKTN